GKTSIFSHPVYLFLREFSLQDSRGGSVKTMKEDYNAFMSKPDVRSALQNLAAVFNHCNENYPHRALGCRSPREYRRQRIMLT
ncbi:hypothetical protein ACU468_005283, partial [Escherichia coli]